MCWNVALLQQGLQMTKIFALTRIFAIPHHNDISLVILFPSNQIYCKYTLKKVQVTLYMYPNQNSISTNGKTIEHSHEPLLFVKLYRLQEGWKSLSLITPLYQWMQLSVACLVPYSSVLFHSYSLLNIAVAHQTFDIATSALLIKLDICCIPNLDRATAYCTSALLIKLKTNARWNSWASNCTSCFNAGRMS